MKIAAAFLLAALFSSPLWASKEPLLSEIECKKMSDIPQTQAARANLTEVQNDILALKSLDGKTIVDSISPQFLEGLKALFETDPTKISKLEQFYGLLHLIGAHKSLPTRRVDFDAAMVRKLLISSKVFSTPDVPQSIEAVTLFWSKSWNRATYAVKFNKSEVRVNLNEGRGFATYKEGLCQVARALVFYGGFEFDVEKTRKGHYFVSQFKDVDIFGTFGARGIVDVDINLISIKSVEFLNGSPMGIVRAKVSRKEFDINEHSNLLRLVTQFVTDKSTQPIDW